MNPLPRTAGTKDNKIKNIGCGSGCDFDLHYFRGKSAPGGKNILFIAGGPGRIEARDNQSLDFLEEKHNIFYIDIRGAGFSAIDKPNKFDTALRAKLIVNDIEQIRIRELGESGAWDAVYGHSHGTIVAQLYAEASPSTTPRLKNLILSAPLSRVKDFEPDRIESLGSNLKSIFENYRHQPAGQTCPPGAPPGLGKIDGTDNFCFLTTGDNGKVEKLVSKFKQKLADLSNHFGSVAFVTEYYDEILKQEPKILKFPSKFPYPKEFYLAIQRLSLFGGADANSTITAAVVREIRVNSAFLLGYYLDLDETRDFKPGAVFNPEKNGCRPEARFFDGVSNAAQTKWKTAFCRRYRPARTQLFGIEKRERKLQSKRANTVYALNDGMAGFIFKVLNLHPSTNLCVDAKKVKDFATETAANSHKSARAVVRRIGVDLTEPICLWNPAKHAHGISTLILKGGGDPIISGGQAEHVFHCGLTGDRVLLEIPGVGHLMQLPEVAGTGTAMPSNSALASLIDVFLTKTVSGFSTDSSVNTLKTLLGATLQTASGPAASGTCAN
jgi:pimeloyl-ACP methyl ester carboxylesterase